MSEQGGNRGVFGGYSAEHRPLGSYATLAGLFNLLFAAVLLLARASSRKIPGGPRPLRPRDIRGSDP